MKFYRRFFRLSMASVLKRVKLIFTCSLNRFFSKMFNLKRFNLLDTFNVWEKFSPQCHFSSSLDIFSPFKFYLKKNPFTTLYVTRLKYKFWKWSSAVWGKKGKNRFRKFCLKYGILSDPPFQNLLYDYKARSCNQTNKLLIKEQLIWTSFNMHIAHTNMFGYRTIYGAI